MFNSYKIPTKNRELQAKKTISTILKNPIYCGYLHWQQYVNKSDHDVIILESDFKEIQNLIASRGGLPYKKLVE